MQTQNDTKTTLYMKKIITTALIAALPILSQAQITPVSQMEKLDRGAVALKSSGTGIFISWRLLGTDDKGQTTFDLLRGSTTIAKNLKRTNYVDTGGTTASEYTIVVNVNGEETERVSGIKPWTSAYKTLSLDRPANGIGNCTYTPNDMSVGDVDGDGQYEIVVKWDPINSKDNSQSGVTGNVYLDAYKMDGSKLWRIDLGRNIRAGAHYTQFLVYDFNKDGKAEVMCKTAPGSIDGSGTYVNQAATDATIKSHDNSKSYVNENGYVTDGPEYLTVFNGETGKAIHTIWYLPNRAGLFNQSSAWLTTNYWGKANDNGNRSDRFLAAVAYLDGADKNPSGVFSRGYYMRAFVWAVDFDGEQLHTKWLHHSHSANHTYRYLGDNLEIQRGYNGVIDYDEVRTKSNGLGNTAGTTTSSSNSGGAGSNTMYSNGNHNLSIADVDGDGKDEIIWGSAALDDNGRMLYSVGYGHGDAIHLGDLDPTRPGLEVFDVHEEKINNGLGCWDVHDAATGEILHKGGADNADNGRGVAADIDSKNLGYEFWSSNTKDESTGKELDDNRHPRSAVTGNKVISKTCSVNFRIYWDGDAQDELFNASYTGSADDPANFVSSPYIEKWSGSSFSKLKEFKDFGSQTCNTTKCTPCLQADILGDWREELIMWNHDNPAEIQIFTTNTTSQYAVPCLMHDHVYRMGIAWQQTSYNQPPHLGYYLPYYLDGTLSGINDVSYRNDNRELTTDKPVFNLNGQRVANPSHGLYIIDNKKLLIK